MIKIEIHVTCEEASKEATDAAYFVADSITEAFKRGLEEYAAKNSTIISKTITETGELKHEHWENPEPQPSLPAPATRQRDLEQEVAMLRQLLVDADEVARRRGDPHGLCDAISNGGEAYPSSAALTYIHNMRQLHGIKPLLYLKDLKGDL